MPMSREIRGTMSVFQPAHLQASGAARIGRAYRFSLLPCALPVKTPLANCRIPTSLGKEANGALDID